MMNVAGACSIGLDSPPHPPEPSALPGGRENREKGREGGVGGVGVCLYGGHQEASR